MPNTSKSALFNYIDWTIGYIAIANQWTDG